MCAGGGRGAGREVTGEPRKALTRDGPRHRATITMTSMVKYLQVVCSAKEMDMSNLPTYPPEPSSCFSLEGPENVV